MTDEGDGPELLRRAGQGDQQALSELFSRHRDRLKRMVRLRLDPRVRPQNLCRLVPASVPSGMPVLEFEACKRQGVDHL